MSLFLEQIWVFRSFSTKILFAKGSPILVKFGLKDNFATLNFSFFSFEKIYFQKWRINCKFIFEKNKNKAARPNSETLN